ncbi:MAG: hypothetical protein RI900_2748, partial [Actinomycetota bacterium]
MRMKSNFRRGWTAVLGGALLIASVSVGADTASAAPILTVASLGPTTSAKLINRVNGGATGITVQADVGTAPPTVLYPYSPGNTFEIKLTGVGKYNAGDATATPPVAPFLEDLTSADAAKVQATWCANLIDADATATPPTAARAVVGSDISSATGAAANCKVFTSFTVTPSHSLGTAGKVDTLTIAGTLDGLPAGRQCTTSSAAGIPLALPCLMVVSDVALGGSSLSLALPIANLTTVSVAGPMNATFTGPVARCVSLSPEPSVGCSSGRQAQVMAWGGAGFAPTSNDLDVAAYTADLTAVGVANAAATAAGTAYNTCVANNGGVGVGEPSCTAELATYAAAGATLTAAVGTVAAYAGKSAGGVGAGAMALCTDSADSATCDNTKVSLVPGLTGYAAGTTDGSLGGAFLVTPTTAPGDYHLRVTYTRVTATGNPASPTTTVTETYMTPFTVLGTPAAVLDPVAGGATFGGAAFATLTVTGMEQNQPLTVQVKDAAGLVLYSTTTKSTGYGKAVVEGLPTDFPADKVFVTSTTAGVGLTPLAITPTTITRDVAACVDAATCATGVILTVDVLPGNLAMYIETNELALAEIDLASIDLSDPTTWYPTGAPAVTELIQIGDFTGSNAGFLVTGGVTDLHGTTLATNLIPAVDVWWSGIACDASATAGSGNDPLGVVTAGIDSEPPT